jgi:tetratricopeptide (TPR) repeat protein
MIEIGTGSNMLFDHPGHYLPPFGTYVMPLRLAMVTGIGRVDWANESVALSYDAPDKDGPATIRVVGFQVRGPVTVMARGRAETAKVTGVLRPETPLVLRLARRAEPVLVNIVEGESADLAEVSLPWKPAPTGGGAFRALQNQVQAKDWLAAELADWPREGAVTLAEAGPMLAKNLSAARIDPALQAARVLLRTEVPPSSRWQAIRDILEVAARSQPENRYIQRYLAMMMTVENGGRPGGPAADHASKAGNFPGARYLVALAAIGSKNLAGALPHLRACGAVGPDVAMGLGSAGIEGNDRVHPAATMEAQWPTLTAVAVLMALQRPKGAIDLLEPMLAADPARPEAMALLADAYAKAGEAAKAQKAAADAKGLFQMNDQAQKDYQRLLREAQEGLWSPPPRPDAATKPAG